MINGNRFEGLGFADLGTALACSDDLDQVIRAVARERVIRDTMAKTGEGREVVVEMADAMESMSQEAVLDLCDGEPTTLADALRRYADELDETPPDSVDAALMGQATADEIRTLLNYPWSGEEERIQLHNTHGRVILETRVDNSRDLEIWIDGQLISTVSWEDVGSGGIEAARDLARAVHRAVLSRIIADREHTVQLSLAQVVELRRWLEEPNGALHLGDRLSMNASEDSLLVRTQPYRYQPPASVHLRDQDRLDARGSAPSGPVCGNQARVIPADQIQRAMVPPTSVTSRTFMFGGPGYS